jgi:hypothetical protein
VENVKRDQSLVANVLDYLICPVMIAVYHIPQVDGYDPVYPALAPDAR